MAITRLLATLWKHPHGLTQIHDGEFFTLRAALSSYLEACEQRIANGEAAPFMSDRSTIKMVFGLLREVIERHSRQRDDAGSRAEETLINDVWMPLADFLKARRVPVSLTDVPRRRVYNDYVRCDPCGLIFRTNLTRRGLASDAVVRTSTSLMDPDTLPPG